MKKFLFFAALAASMGIMTSCSQEDDYISSSGIDSNTIVFATSPTKGETRSAVTINSIDNFTVSAVSDDNKPLFSNEMFTYDGSAKVFKSQTPFFWPTTQKLSFYAINDPGTLSVDANNVPKYTYSDWTAEKDIVAATVKAGTRQTPYPLTFKHLTSQIYVSSEAADKTNDLSYKLVSIKLTAPSTGTYSFATETNGVGTWEIDGTKTSEYSYDDNLPVSFKQDKDVSFGSTYWNILPVFEGMISFAIEYQVIQDGKIICDYTGDNKKVCEIGNPRFKAGYKYCYRFTLSANIEEITFTMSMSDWENGNTSTIITSPVEANGHEYVDLELPSGIKWATMNVGAISPDQYGDYFAWSETVPRYTSKTQNNYYSLALNGWTDEHDWGYSNLDYPSYSNATLDALHDAARQNWGGNWRTPTKEEFIELNNNCTLEFVNLNGSPCNKYISKINGKSIVLPQAGSIKNGTPNSLGSRGHYWTSTKSTNNINKAIFFEVFAPIVYTSYDMDTCNGLTVRPVFD